MENLLEVGVGLLLKPELKAWTRVLGPVES